MHSRSFMIALTMIFLLQLHNSVVAYPEPTPTIPKSDAEEKEALPKPNDESTKAENAKKQQLLFSTSSPRPNPPRPDSDERKAFSEAKGTLRAQLDHRRDLRELSFLGESGRLDAQRELACITAYNTVTGRLRAEHENAANSAQAQAKQSFALTLGRLTAEKKFASNNKKSFFQKLKDTLEGGTIRIVEGIPTAITVLGLQQLQRLWSEFMQSNTEKKQRSAEQSVERFIQAQQEFLKIRIELLKQREAYTALLKAKEVSPEFFKKMATYTALCGKEQEYLLLEKCRRLIGRLPDNNTPVASNKPKALLAHGQHMKQLPAPQRRLSAQQAKLVAKTATPVGRSNTQAASLPSSLVNAAIDALATI